MRPLQIASIAFYCIAAIWTAYMGISFYLAIDKVSREAIKNTGSSIYDQAGTATGITLAIGVTGPIWFIGWMFVFAFLITIAIVFGIADKKKRPT